MKPYIFTVGNIKGGAGKTSVSMHLISSLIDMGFKVCSIDTDVHQQSLTNYINNRKNYIRKTSRENDVKIPEHYLIDTTNFEDEEIRIFEKTIQRAQEQSNIIVIDTPGSFCNLSCIAHSYADTIITPINDSFLDLDLLAEVDADSLKIKKLSIYTEMVWKQKLKRAQRDKGNIKWVVVRNRLSNIDAKNKRAISHVLSNFSAKLRCTLSNGFSERVIFKELFLKGITLLDLKGEEYSKQMLTLSNIAARQELRNFMKNLDIEELKKKYL